MNLEKLALFSGMLVGDGYVSNRKNGFGYTTYSISLFNTKRELVELFYNLHFDLFGEKGKIGCRKRKGRKDLYQFCKYSKISFDYVVNDLGIPYGKKAAKVRIPKIILESKEDIVKLYFFLGLLITDGFVNKKGVIGFHMASKNLLIDLNKLITCLWGFDKEVKTVIQKKKYFSYQLNLNKGESKRILSDIFFAAIA
jgi:hypothetical protein